MDESASVATFLFTDIEGSSRLWEQEPARMQVALSGHDRAARASVEAHRGHVVKLTGDGICAAFDDPLDALRAALAFQQALARLAEAQDALPLHARCGMHLGVAERRDGDFFGNTLNRAARIMSAAHGGQVLLSQAVVDLVRGRLPDDLSLRDLGHVRLRDLTSPERLYQLQHASLRRDFPALRSLEATPNNLPQQATSFVGRERELAEVREALGRTRLLTLVGAGGIGKTRLSLQVAAEVLDDYPDGVWFVELAPLADERLVIQAVATALGVKEEGATSLLDALVRDMADKRLLLVLDNCEHLLGACATLAERLLRGAAAMRILASSREPLRIPGEATYPVPPLDVPAAGAAGNANYAASPAVQLFAERAIAVLPTFHLDAGNGPTVADICRHLDGIPLAIELAAARARALSVDAIASRLGDRFRLLTSGSRTALPRQQTLRALIDWSHDLLNPPERALFRRLSVFAGGWTIDAAEIVCAGGEVPAAETLDLLASLVDKSLVVADVERGRYRMLETIREYAAERLAAAEESAGVGALHLDHFLAFAEEAQSRLAGPDQPRWIARLAVELENLLAAHTFCSTGPDGAARGLRLANALKLFWFNQGLLRLGKRVTLEALGRPGAEARNLERCLALFNAGQLCTFGGEHDEAVRYLAESLSIAREADDRRRIAATLQPLAFAEFGRGRADVAKVHAEEALALAREIGDDDQVASALNAVAQIRRAEGDLNGAEPLYDEVVAVGRKRGDRELVAIGLLNLAMVYVSRGAASSARVALAETLAIAEEAGSVPVGQSALDVAAGFAATLGQHAIALRFFGAAEANKSVSGIVRDPTDDAFLKPLVQFARDALGDGAEAAERAGAEAGYRQVVAEVRAWVATAGSEPAGAAATG